MTRTEHLFSLLGELDDDLIEEAAMPRAEVRPLVTAVPISSPTPRKEPHWKRWAALAACLLLVVGIWRFFPRMGSSEAPNEAEPPSAATPGEMPPSASGDPGEPTPNSPGAPDGDVIGNGDSYGSGGIVNGLPVLTFSGQLAEGGGGSGIWTNDVASYISNGLPADTTEDTMPVYVSALPRDEYGNPAATEADQETLLANILSRLSLSLEDCTITSVGFLTAVAPDGTEIWIRRDLAATVFLPMDGLPDTIRSADEYSFKAMNDLGQAVIQELDRLLNMESPTACVTGGDVNLYGKTHFYLTIHDGTPTDPTDPIARVSILEDVLVLDLDGRVGQELVAEYPVIPPEEAEELLLTGSWPGYDEKYYVIPTAEQILRSELVYCTDAGGLTMPYYRFYLDLGETIALCDPGTKLATGETVSEIALYYIPAVEAEYLAPSYSGLTFNS